MDIMFVKRDIHVIIACLIFKKHTRERNRVNVLFVGRDFHLVVVCLITKEHALSVVSLDIKQHTGEKSLEHNAC